MNNSTNTVLEPKTAKEKYPEARVIVLDELFINSVVAVYL